MSVTNVVSWTMCPGQQNRMLHKGSCTLVKFVCKKCQQNGIAILMKFSPSLLALATLGGATIN
jgi:hypothetical protein